MARHVVSSTFAVLYFLITLFLLTELVQMRLRKANLRSFKAAYNYLTVVWALLRSTFWGAFALDANFPSGVFYFMFWVPLSLQYITFALLAVFLLKLIVGTTAWRATIRATAHKAMVAVAVLSSGGTLLLVVLASAAADATAISNAELLFYAISYMALSSAYLALALKLRGVAPGELTRAMLPSAGVVSGVTVTIMLVFLSRAVYDVCAYANVVSTDIAKDDIETDLTAVLVYGIWEFFPLVLLLSTLAAAPKGARASDARTPTFGVFGFIQALEDDAASGSDAQSSAALLLGANDVGSEDTGRDDEQNTSADGIDVAGFEPRSQLNRSLATGGSSGFLRRGDMVSSDSLTRLAPPSPAFGAVNDAVGVGGGNAAVRLNAVQAGGGGLGVSGGLLSRPLALSTRNVAERLRLP